MKLVLQIALGIIAAPILAFVGLIVLMFLYYVVAG